MKNNIDIASPDVWKSLLTHDDYVKVEEIIEKMKCDPKPTVMEFLSSIRRSLEVNLITKQEIA